MAHLFGNAVLRFPMSLTDNAVIGALPADCKWTKDGKAGGEELLLRTLRHCIAVMCV